MPEPAITERASAPESATPMMRQYLAIRESYPDYLLFYRMGDFYELFFDDAVKAAEALDIALTRRGRHLGDDIPMCGVPAHSYEPYLQKLIRKGFKVAICEQMEPPEEAKKRGAKSVVKREVVRIITPGTITEDALLDATSANYLVSVAEAAGKVGLSWVDISTGEFKVMETSRKALPAELSRLKPRELLLPDRMLDDKAFYAALSEWREGLTPHVASFFEAGRAERRIKEYFKVASLDAFGDFSQAEVGACGSLLEYLELTQLGNLPRLEPPKKLESQEFMAIDAATRRNLELTHTLSGEYRGSLLSIINRTCSAMGARLLFSQLSSPLLDPAAISHRLDMVEYFLNHPELRAKIRDGLRALPDMERTLSRICIGRAGPRDLLSLRQGLFVSMHITSLLEQASKEDMPAGIQQALRSLDNHDQLLSLLERAVQDEVPLLARDGGFIKEGFDPSLDEMRRLRDESESAKTALRDRYRQETGLEKMKLAQNNIIGMYLEITAAHADKIPSHFVHRQTMAGAMRYSTPELKELESKLINALGHALARELHLFDGLCASTREKAEEISLTAQGLAVLDVASGLAELACEKQYMRPTVDSGCEFHINKGRHPVVEESLKSGGASFIGNDCTLAEENRLWLITGPNMAGKSTFLRQNALITILAQMGSFVPAESARIGVVDRLFSRVGAADDLARGRSTFMVEMVETATILHQSTARSLVILDEIGRGTATFDGLSLAWAVMEYLHDRVRCRTLFATHYHELTTLSSRLSALGCYTMKVKEWQGEVVFLHEVVPGTADRSYGIHVARLAGLPKDVIQRAEEVMATLEGGEAAGAISRLAEDLPLFVSQAQSTEDKAEIHDSLRERLQGLEPDSLSPREALDVLYQLKNLLK
jgi:DNA mismatch repair protein MutS